MPLCFFLEKLMPKKGKNVLAIMLSAAKPKGGSKKADSEERGYDEDHESEEEPSEDEEEGYGEAFADSLKDAIKICLEKHESEEY